MIRHNAIGIYFMFTSQLWGIIHLQGMALFQVIFLWPSLLPFMNPSSLRALLLNVFKWKSTSDRRGGPGRHSSILDSTLGRSKHFYCSPFFEKKKYKSHDHPYTKGLRCRTLWWIATPQLLFWLIDKMIMEYRGVRRAILLDLDICVQSHLPLQRKNLKFHPVTLLILKQHYLD